MSTTITVPSGDSRRALLRGVLPTDGLALLEAGYQYGYLRDLYPLKVLDYKNFVDTDAFTLQEMLAYAVIDALMPGNLHGWMDRFDELPSPRLIVLDATFAEMEVHVALIDLAQRISVDMFDRVENVITLVDWQTRQAAGQPDYTLGMNYHRLAQICRVAALWLTCEDRDNVSYDEQIVAQACVDLIEQVL